MDKLREIVKRGVKCWSAAYGGIYRRKGRLFFIIQKQTCTDKFIGISYNEQQKIIRVGLWWFIFGVDLS